MKSRNLFAVMALVLGAATTAQAGDWDDRWYFAPWLGAYHNDGSRDTDDFSLLVGAGIGKYVAPNTTVDVFVDRVSRHRDPPYTSQWANTMFGVSVRYYFGDEAGWQPYIMAGAGMSNHRANANGGPEGGRAGDNYGWDPALQLGLGLASNYNEDIRFRAELAYRYDMDDNSRFDEDNYGDVMLNFGVMWGFGHTETAAAAVTQTQTTTQQTTPPPAKQPPAPAQPEKVVIDLRGVNFRFDYPKKGETDINKAGLVEGSIALLDQAVDVLKRYPNVRVEVDGHTDSVGTDEYNQGLSERRAQIVYDYLTSHGIDRSRLMGPKGFGEKSPIDTNDTKEGRARNRRTELVVQ